MLSSAHKKTAAPERSDIYAVNQQMDPLSYAQSQ